MGDMVGRWIKHSHTDYLGLPEHIRDGIERYIEQGIEPGGFCEAVICNNLTLAVMQADSINRHRLFDIVSWFYNEAPSACWGSPEKYQAWVKQGGYGA